MKKELFQELLASVEEMAATEAGRAKPRRITRGADLLASDVRAPESDRRGTLIRRCAASSRRSEHDLVTLP